MEPEKKGARGAGASAYHERCDVKNPDYQDALVFAKAARNQKGRRPRRGLMLF
jgi:hypothetical protein